MRTNTTRQEMVCSSHPPKYRGFALVATISVMVLLVMVALAMLSLSTITLRSAQHDSHMEEARANARLALMLALGEMQKSIGPDQRVTAEGMLDAASGHGKSHWVGVWKSEDADNDNEPDGEFIDWLVSKELGGSQYSLVLQDAPANDPDWISMVGNGSADTTADSNSAVLARRMVVSRKQPGNGSNLTSGHYAWWVGDEGLKARVDLQNTQKEIPLASQGTQRASVEVMSGFESIDSTSDEITKMITTGTVAHVSGATQDSVRKHFHDATVHSLALQTNTRHGGLKKDLSLLFELSDADYEDLAPSEYADYTNEKTPISSNSNVPKGLLFNDQGVHGPTIDLLRNHYRQYKANAGSQSSPLMVASASYPNKTEFGADMWRRTACIQAWHWGLETDTNTSNTLKPRWWGKGEFSMPRLLKGNVTPYLNRVVMYFSVQAVPVADASPNDPSDDKYNLHLKLQPILYVHNPYNVRMRVDGMRYLKNISQAELWIAKDGGTPEEIDFTALLDANDEAKPITSGGRQGEAQFIVDQATTFAPGEMKIFVPSINQNWGSEMKMIELGDSFQPDEMALTLDLTYVTGNGGGPTAAISQIPSGTELQMTLKWSNFAKEDFEIFENVRGDYNTVWSALSHWRPDYSTGAITRNGKRDAVIAPKYQVEELKTITPIIIGDRFIKPLKFDRHESAAPNGNGSASTTIGCPSFVIGNPLCSSDSNALGVNGNVGRTPGAGVYSNMSHSHLDFGQVGYPYFQNAFIDNYGTWGSNNGSAGERYSTVLEVPSAPLFSLGALQHANIAVEGYQPALAIGNSYPNLTMKDHANLVEASYGMQNYDLSYMANRALWDDYFFSSITPRPSDGSYSSISTDSKSDISAVIQEFVEGKQSLGNTRMSLAGSGMASDTRQDELRDYRRSAAHLAVAGGFNINSTSVQAWQAFLSGYRDVALRSGSGGSESNKGVSSFPRMSSSNKGGVLNPRAMDSKAWRAYAQLSDDQISNLAEAIVAELKDRAKVRVGTAPVTPVLTMGQFVNRMLVGGGNKKVSGILQAAIDQSGINNTMAAYGMYDSSDYGTLPEQHAYDGDGKNLNIPVASPAPSVILQSDLLQALGASMTPRSDTFIVRSYGDAVDSQGHILARAWCEAVVQRVPHPVISDSTDAWEPATTAAGVKFGRRFRVISFRWLAKEEI